MSCRLRLSVCALAAGLSIPSFAADSPSRLPTALCAAAASHAVPASLVAWTSGAQFFDGLGDFHRTTTTGSAEAQRYFDQGMRLLWAFNHDEATRSFAKAGALDPD